MGNHQMELAEALSEMKHVVNCQPSTLVQTIRDGQWERTKPFPPSPPTSPFLHILETHLNLNNPTPRVEFMY
jgi:UDP-N-acetylglucosamine transferase subunit ALG13